VIERGGRVIKRTILLVDDEPDFVEMIRMRLEANNYKVTTATNGEEGLARVKESTPDLVLLDVMMPRMDGFEFLRRMRADPKARQVPVVMLTAKGESKSIFKAQDLGITDYLIKPCESQELLDIVARYA
jgi:adenylate cyclase